MRKRLHKNRNLFCAVVTVAALAPVTVGAAAVDAFPSRPIRIVVGFTAGTTTDFTARLLGAGLAPRLGQNVVIENRPGASSGLANQMVEQATPDGHTLLLGTLSLVTGPMLYKKLPFDPREFVPVSLLVLSPNVICVYPGVPAHSIKDLITLAKSRPNELRYGSSGRGSSAFLTLELLKSMADIKMREIPYKATSQAVADTMGGQIDVYPPNLVSAIPLLKTGRLRPLAVTSAKRASSLPEIPAVSETVPGYDATTGVYGILVPSKTPQAVINRLEREIRTVAATPEFRREIEIRGGEVIGSTSREYASYLKQQEAKWHGLFGQINILPQ